MDQTLKRKCVVVAAAVVLICSNSCLKYANQDENLIFFSVHASNLREWGNVSPFI